MLESQHRKHEKSRSILECSDDNLITDLSKDNMNEQVVSDKDKKKKKRSSKEAKVGSGGPGEIQRRTLSMQG